MQASRDPKLTGLAILIGHEHSGIVHIVHGAIEYEALGLATIDGTRKVLNFVPSTGPLPCEHLAHQHVLHTARARRRVVVISLRWQAAELMSTRCGEVGRRTRDKQLTE